MAAYKRGDPINSRVAPIWRKFNGEEFTLSRDIGGVPADYDGVPKRFADSVAEDARRRGQKARLVKRKGGGYLVYVR